MGRNNHRLLHLRSNQPPKILHALQLRGLVLHFRFDCGALARAAADARVQCCCCGGGGDGSGWWAGIRAGDEGLGREDEAEETVYPFLYTPV